MGCDFPVEMRTSLLLVALCCGLTLAAGAAASPTDVSPATDDPSPVADNGTDGNDTAVGICVVGADSPCNGERWDGDGNRTAGDGTLTPVDGGDRPTDDAQPPKLPDENRTAGNDTAVGICVVGADSPCNGERWDGDRTTENGGDDRSAPVDGVDERLPANGSESAGVGICRIGVDSPCNADRWSGLPVSLHAVPGGDLIGDTLSRVLDAPA
jgi:hypothetical protein